MCILPTYYTDMKHAIIIILVLVCTAVDAQINDSSYLLSIAASGNFNRTNESKSYLLSNQIHFGVSKEAFDMNVNSNYVFGQQQQKRTNSDLSMAIDYNRYIHHNRKFYAWGLTTYDKSLSLKINNRMQVGAGLAFSFIDTTSAYFNISDGLLYEKSNLQINDTLQDVYHTIRNSLRVRGRVSVLKLVVIETSTFWQPSLQYSNDYVIKSVNGLSLKLNRWLSINAQLIYNTMSRLHRENLLTTFGLKVDKYL
jgi:hypothetical protein